MCQKCQLNSRNVQKDKGFRFYFWYILNGTKDFCTICKCELKAKASEEYEKCPENKWKI